MNERVELAPPPDRATVKREGFFRWHKAIPQGGSLGFHAVRMMLSSQSECTKPAQIDYTKLPSSRNENLFQTDPTETLSMEDVKRPQFGVSLPVDRHPLTPIRGIVRGSM